MDQIIKILLVEDNPGDVMLMEELLQESKRFNFSITNSETLGEGLKLVQKDELDIVLLDLGLPDSHGLDALETMLGKVNHLPIVVITGLDDDETGRKAINMGAQSYIIKGLSTSRVLTDSILHAIERNNILLELKKKDAEMERINTQLNHANHSKEHLIALLSHDLRGPLEAVISLLELMEVDFDTIDDEKKKQMLKACSNSGKSTLELMETLLNWARLQSDERKIQPQKTALKTFIDKSMEPVRAMAAHKKLIISNQASDDHFFYADKDMIATVIRNLLTNAVKFTPKNGTITVKSEKTANGGVLIFVKDTGVGINEENIDKIFDLSARFTTAGTEKEIGSGFGMILCKEFVEKNKGNMKIESEPGKGTKIGIELPASDSN